MINYRRCRFYWFTCGADSLYSGVIAQWLMHLKASNLITVYGDGTASRGYCYVANVAQATHQISEAALPNSHSVYNIGNEQATTLQELSHILIKLTGQSVEQIKYAP